jgi:hypothetical protein
MKIFDIGYINNNNEGNIYTYNGGITINEGIIENDTGSISTAIGGTCGVGIFSGTLVVTGTVNSNCPPE